MVTLKEKFSYLPNGEIDLDRWLLSNNIENVPVIKKAAYFTKNFCKGLTTFYGQPCIEQGLEMAEIMLDLKLDSEAVAAAILSATLPYAKSNYESLMQTEFSPSLTKLILGIQKLNIIPELVPKNRDRIQLDRLRKLLLSLVSDIRAVLVKLAERTCIMRRIKKINLQERKNLAQETMDIYAPLANRLGIGQIKWELEDLAFHYIHPETYKTIAQFLSERRIERESRINAIVEKLKNNLLNTNIKSDISGRAKHIYSIYLKMQKKHLSFNHIYDYSAVRIIVPSVEDCYTALGIVHRLWDHIPEEFDDYIANPKSNGYRSIHTAVIDPGGKNFEIQIRSQAMHDEAERGLAAHWLYKENKSHDSGYETKIKFLRQLLDWHKDIASKTNNDQLDLSDKSVYVFTPAGDILELPTGSTPLDFAYHVHSEIGHRCRGAKIKDHISSLTTPLQTGDRVEILTIPQGEPSRDWLNTSLGYIKTVRAKAKILQWFKHKEQDHQIETGKKILERELNKEKITINTHQLVQRLRFKSDNAFFSALGSGSLRISHILQSIKETPQQDNTSTLLTLKKASEKNKVFISGIQDLMKRIAKCCKPIPGDDIIGFITQGRGISIHKKSCNNIKNLVLNQNRLMAVKWDNAQLGDYYADIQIRANFSNNLLKDATFLLSNNKIEIVSLKSNTNKKNNISTVIMTIRLTNISQLNLILNQLQQLPHVFEVKRISD